jgi:hypothetical protein
MQCSLPRKFAKLTGLILVLLVTFCLETVSAEDQSQVILSHLPTKESAEYKALHDLASPAAAQDLAMTGAEMWSVPAAQFDALREVAAKQGVEVRHLDAGWNHVLAPMAPGTKMTPKQEEMMQMAMDSNAAMGMSVMNLPEAAMMEYALTKGMNAPVEGTPPSLVIPLTDKLTVTAHRTEISKTEDGYIWRGVIDPTGEPVTLLWWPSGRLAGTFDYGGHSFVIKNLDGGMHGMLELLPDKMPPTMGLPAKR